MLFGSKDKKIEHAIAKKNPAGVIGFFEDKDENIRLMAIDAAGKIGGDDCMNALMAIPNLIALVALSGVIVAETKSYFKRLEAGHIDG